ncbi:MAG: TIGR03086 family metal-binding protein [Ilumatobacter sp.]|uniref:TIGR03086 family metal-binding protein n=1 Tax=Ilumatobacter sp. TaxID=1967498 RepID=UPI0026052A8E|nr:TIGR03086 family metal-binding protein [Ilumatobacter sp.]MDJ0769570.1 TIGR03086 family metal-binding protein [Ilumatobacter sp.]
MDATTAMHQTFGIVDDLVAGLTPDDREKSTPCTEWNVHELINHMCGGGHGIASGLQGQAPPEGGPPDFLADGPSAGWEAMKAHLAEAATPEILSATHQMPFGEVPGEMALSVIVADHLTHAWDLAQATGQGITVSDDLAAFAHGVWQNLVPAEGRPEEGGGFKPVVSVGDDASALDQLIGYTGRTP